MYTDGIHCWTSIYWFTSSHITRATTANDFCNHRVDKRTLNHQPWQVPLSKPNTSSLIIVFSILPPLTIGFLEKINLLWNKQKNFTDSIFYVGQHWSCRPQFRQRYQELENSKKKITKLQEQSERLERVFLETQLEIQMAETKKELNIWSSN